MLSKLQAFVYTLVYPSILGAMTFSLGNDFRDTFSDRLPLIATKAVLILFFSIDYIYTFPYFRNLSKTSDVPYVPYRSVLTWWHLPIDFSIRILFQAAFVGLTWDNTLALQPRLLTPTIEISAIWVLIVIWELVERTDDKAGWLGAELKDFFFWFTLSGALVAVVSVWVFPTYSCLFVIGLTIGVLFYGGSVIWDKNWGQSRL